MQTFTQAKVKTPKSIILAGEPGSGKTTLALQFPKLAVLDCDVNLDGAVRHLREQNKFQDFYYGCPLISDDGKPVPRLEQYNRASRLLGDFANNPDIETIFIDSATTFFDLLITKVKELQKRKVLEADLSAKVSFDESMQVQDWGMFFNEAKKLIFKLKSTGKTILLAVHIKTEKDQLTQALHKALAVPGQTGDMIAGWFSEVWKINRIQEGVGLSAKCKYTVQVFPSSPTESALGLKTSCGLKQNQEVDASKFLASLYQ